MSQDIAYQPIPFTLPSLSKDVTFLVTSGRKDELQRSNTSPEGRGGAAVRRPPLSRIQWNEPLQFKRLLSVQGTQKVFNDNGHAQMHSQGFHPQAQR